MENIKISWLDCPYGKINDPYPGSCGRYIDINGNKICDHSEAAPAEGLNLNQKLPEKVNNQINFSSQNATVMWVFYSSLAIFFLYWFLTEKTSLGKSVFIFSQKFFRFFWNVVLFVAFSLTAASGFVDFLSPDRFFRNLHVLSGVVFIVVGIMHFLQRLSYFKIIIKDISKGAFTKKEKDS